MGNRQIHYIPQPYRAIGVFLNRYDLPLGQFSNSLSLSSLGIRLLSIGDIWDDRKRGGP
jgi:hypothetical protein